MFTSRKRLHVLCTVLLLDAACCVYTVAAVVAVVVGGGGSGGSAVVAAFAIVSGIGSPATTKKDHRFASNNKEGHCTSNRLWHHTDKNPTTRIREA